MSHEERRPYWILNYFCPADVAPEMVAVWTVAGLLTALFYISIPIVVMTWLRRTYGLRRAWQTARGRLLLLAGAFVLACGATHFFKETLYVCPAGVYQVWLWLTTAAFIWMGTVTAAFGYTLSCHFPGIAVAVLGFLQSGERE